MILSFAVFPASAAVEDVTLKITPDKTKIDTSAGDVVVEYTISVEVKDSSVKIGGMQFGLNPPSGMTLPTKFKDGSNTLISYINKSEWRYDSEEGTGIFESFGYTPTTNIFIASGTTTDRNLHENKDLMKIRVTIAKGTTGSLTLTDGLPGTPTVFSKIDGTNKWSYTVETTPVTISKAPISSVSFTLDKPTQGAALPSLSGLGSGYTGAVEWYEGTSTTGSVVTDNAKPNTKYTAKVTLTAGSGESFADSVSIPTDYTKVSADATTIVLTKTFDATDSLPAATVTNPPAAMTGLKYDGTEHVLLGFKGTAANGTMQYSLNNSTWSEEIPKGKDAGDYTVYYKAVGNSGYSDSAVASISATIGQKNISTVTIDPIPDQTYTGNAITPDPEVKDGTTTLKKGTDYTVSYDKNKYVGTNTAKLTITGKGNYTGTKSANFTIVAADQNPTFTTPVDLVTGGHRLNLTTLVDGAKGDMIFTITSGNAANLETGNTLVSTGTTGVVKIKVSIAAKDVNDDTINEYNAFSKSDAITVNVVATPAASVTAAPTAKTDLKYNGNDQALVSAGTANGGTMQYSLDNSTWSDAIPKGKDAKTYTVYYKVKGDSDHTDFTPTSNTVSVSIAPKVLHSSDLEKFGGSATKAYDGTATSSITVRVKTSSLYGTDTLSINGSAVYNSANVSDANKITFTPTAITTGNYRLAATEVLTINNAKITAKDVKLTGGINATDRSYVKDNKTVNLTKGALTFDGLVSGETLDVNIPATGTISDAKVGTYNVTYSGVTLKDGTGKASNYKLVSPLPTVTVNITQALTPTAPTGLTGVKGNKLVSVALPAGWSWANPTQEMTTDGSQTFTANYTDQEGNYAPGTGISVHVNVKDKTDVSTNITFPNGSLVYNGHGQEYKKATISGIIAGDTPSWTYTYAVDSSTTATLNSSGLPLTVGKYKVTAIYEDSANYGTATATLEITPAKPTGTPTFTKITEKGKTLADANLGMGTLTPTGGTLDWVDDSDHVLPGNTKVEANKEYKWRYTPASADAVNYAPVYGTIVVYPVFTGIVIYSPCYTIKASAGANGTISPAGWCSVVENGSQTFTFTPDKGYTVAKVLVDGKSVGAVKSYTFKDVTKDHTIEVIFMKSNGNPATGVFVMP